jgi:hypothetical protein
MHRAGLGSVYVATEDRGSVWAPSHVLLLLLAVIVVVVVVVVIVVVVVVIVVLVVVVVVVVVIVIIVVVVVVVIVVVSSFLSFSRTKGPFPSNFQAKSRHTFLSTHSCK